jgi:FemAB-related protein (PEP-CTERM system-associated)
VVVGLPFDPALISKESIVPTAPNDVSVNRGDGPGDLVFRAYAAEDRKQWDSFVLQHAHGSPFHLIAWQRAIEESFGYQPRYILATDGERIRGVLPLFLVRNPIIGRVLLSAPFAVYGGILADCIEARAGLYEHVRGLGQALGVDYIELRNAYPEQCVGQANVDRYVTFSKEVPHDEESLWADLPKKTRNLVRKSMRTAFTVRYGVQDLRIMDAVHARNLRRLGTPNFPRRYFELLLRHFGEMADVRETWFDNKPMGVSLNLFFRDQMHTFYAATDTRYNALAPNMFMYFDHLRWAGQSGYRIFDFGRSKKGTGVFEFKKHWNTTMRELPYEIILVKRKTLPNFSPANPAFAWPIRIWQKLPLPITRLVSRHVINLFP